ncbi:phage head-tail connector protein [Kibdelosporangium philippinense]|uniref:phage head-tail connector protein n=1 Tax=Kibdelosporangium philippinense TaxID=211113 RepID=UPI00361653B2
MAITIYADLATLKDSLKITDTDDDDQLTKNLNGASRAIDTVTGRRFSLDDNVSARKLRTDKRTVELDNGEQLLLVPDIATDAGLIVETGSKSTWTPVTDYELYPEDALVGGWPITGLTLDTRCWPSMPGQRVRITAKWGWSAVPDDIEQACLILSRRLFARKDSPVA